MEWGRLGAWFGKYKYAIVVLAVGIGLMLLPEGGETPAAEQTREQHPMTLAEELEQILSQIEGAGAVRVLLTEAVGGETQYQTDTNENGDSKQVKTVIVTDSGRNEQGLVVRSDPPEYLGAVIVCRGAELAQVRLALVDAVRCATGLGADRITVVKMK